MQILDQSGWLIPLFPFLSALLLGIGLLSFRRGTRSLRWTSAAISIAFLGFSMMLSFGLFWNQIFKNSAHISIWSWITTEAVSLEIGYVIDPLSSIMLVLVTTVGIAVMIYTDGYMSHDEGYVRFFIYLSLFTASMLGLVLSSNLIQIYAFWELVGMCSYLLVGFWFTRPSAAAACQKAFVTNRIGDFGLLLGILGFYWITGSFDFDKIAQRFSELLSTNNVNLFFAILCSLLLFLGPVAKSAQFPLHVWLPDAMESPTPISALIHAATMVAAGIFLVARLLPLFQNLPFIMDTIAITGVSTALLGASLALAQRDLKRGLAYSTMSQLGYMMLALGIGSYKAGLFHLITHAYSKALLFLGSGSVIHGMEPAVGYNPNKSQDMGYMGGIRKYMPVTGITFLIGTLSLCGIPPFACFWSKDEILADAWAKMPVLGWIAWFTAGLTAFYMFRMYFLTFEGDFRGLLSKSESKSNKPHESNVNMVAPLVALSVPTVFIGFLGAPLLLGKASSLLFSNWLHIIDLPIDESDLTWTEFFQESLPSVGIAVTGAFLAWVVYGPHASNNRNLVEFLDPYKKGMVGIVLNNIYNWSLRRGYIDELYNKTLISGTRSVSNFLFLFDQWFVDGIVNNIGLLSLFGGESTRYGEVGRTTAYLFVLGITTFSLVSFFFVLSNGSAIGQ
jgi:NAD(P)H-quinone oxidoreductase subunit 5